MSDKTDVEIEAPGLSMRIPPHVLEAVTTVPWAITDEYFATIMSIVNRTNDRDISALSAYRAARVPGADRLEVRDGVGIIQARGPMVRYANLFTEISGATSYDALARDVQRLSEDASLSAGILNLDTPGGEVTGVSELAAQIKAVSSRKRIVAYVGGSACSAGYWLAAACSEIVINDTALLGSIGVVMAIRDSKERDAKSGVKTVEFVSSRAPNKRLDYDSDEGKAKILKIIDQAEAVFVSKVAAYRGVTDEDVVTKFGGGGVETGASAVEAGLADRLGSFEGVLSELSQGRSTRGGKVIIAMSDKVENVKTQAEFDAAVTAARNEGRTIGSTEERARIGAIMDHAEAADRPTQARHLAFKSTMSADDATAMLAASAKEAAPEPTAEEKKAAEEKAKTEALNANRSKGSGSGLAGIADGAAAPATKTAERPAFDRDKAMAKFGNNSAY